MIIKRILKDWGLEALILFLFIYFILPFGPAITFDSVSFFQAGDFFWSEGRYVHYGADGFMEFAAHRFPLYPLILGAVRAVGIELITLQIILFIAFVAGMRRLFKELNSPKYAFLFLATFPILLNFFCLWTESLYAVLFVWLCLLVKKDESYTRLGLILLIVGLLSITRMVGLVVAGSLLIAYLIENRKLRGFILFAVSLCTILLWTFLGQFYLGETAREMGWHPVNYQDFQFILIELGYWLTAVDQKLIMFSIGGAILLVPLISIFQNWRSRKERGLLFWFLHIHFVAYLFFIIAAKSVLDSSIAFDERTWFPLMVNFILIIAVLQSGKSMTEKQRSVMKFMLPKVLILVVILNVPLIMLVRTQGVGYNGADWEAFEFPEVLAEMESDLTFTNDQAALYLFADQMKRPALLPQKQDLYSKEQFPTYTAEMDVMIEQLKESDHGKIVWVRNGITGEVFPSFEELQEIPQLKVVYNDWLCLILEYDPATNK